MENTTTTLEELVVRNGELHIRQVSAIIADYFDDLLADNNILVPDEDREGNEWEAPLYGSTYSDFEGLITEQLEAIVSDARTAKVDTASAKEVIYTAFIALLHKHNLTIPHDKNKLFADMENWIVKLVDIATKHPMVPVNNWEY